MNKKEKEEKLFLKPELTNHRSIMSSPDRQQYPLQSAEYYLKSISWQMKVIADSLKESVMAQQSLNNKIDGIIQRKQAAHSIQPGRAPAPTREVEETPF